MVGINMLNKITINNLEKYDNGIKWLINQLDFLEIKYSKIHHQHIIEDNNVRIFSTVVYFDLDKLITLEKSIEDFSQSLSLYNLHIKMYNPAYFIPSKGLLFCRIYNINNLSVSKVI